MGRFAGKVALITGGARGQGRSHAVRFAEEGADIVTFDICGRVHEEIVYAPSTPDDLAETVKLVQKHGQRIIARQVDVRVFAEVNEAVGEALAEFGRIDIVVANAGIVSFGWGWEISESLWDATINTNLKGVWNTLRSVIPPMIATKRGGSIIITSAATEIRDQPFIAHYVASKAATVGLMKVFSKELAQYNIRVNTVNPTAVNTPMTTHPAVARLFETEELMLPGTSDSIQMPTLVEPDEVSDVVLYLASDEAQSISGIQFPVEPRSAIKDSE